MLSRCDFEPLPHRAGLSMIWVTTEGSTVDETGDGSVGACDVFVRRGGFLARQTGFCVHGDT
jgi:hypothetical protein